MKITKKKLQKIAGYWDKELFEEDKKIKKIKR